MRKLDAMPQKLGPKPTFTDSEIDLQLRRHGGLIGPSARALTAGSKNGKSITRQGLTKRINASPFLQGVLADLVEELKDIAEGSLYKQIREGSERATMWYLATKARDRGYGQQVGIAGGFDETGRPIPLSAAPTVVIYIPDNGRDPKLVDITPTPQIAKPNGGKSPARAGRTNAASTSSNGQD